MNLIEVPTEIGSSVQLQLWLARSNLSKSALKRRENCAASALPMELRLRPEAVGLVLNGFPGEVKSSLRALMDTPGCLHAYLDDAKTVKASSVLAQLARHLQHKKFDLGVLTASTESTAIIKTNLAPILGPRSDNRLPLNPVTGVIESRLKTYQSSGKGELRVGFPLYLPTPEALADLELVVTAIRNLGLKGTWASVKLLPTPQTGLFVMELVQHTPAEQVKSRLTQLIKDICLDHDQWSNAHNFILARRAIESELTKESNISSAQAERLGRTQLIFGAKANKRWHSRLTQVGHYEWLKSVQSRLQAQAVMIEVGISKDVIGTPDFELAFFEEVLAEELRHLGQRKAPSVASTRSDILIYHKRSQKHQSLRVAIGLPRSSRSGLTANIKQTISDCIRSNRKYDIHVDFEHGTLNLQSQFIPAKLNDVLDDWSEALRQSCRPMTLPARQGQAVPSPFVTDSLHNLISDRRAPATSTGTQVIINQNPMSAQRWWRALFAQRPPLQFFAAGPLGSETIAPLLNRWQPWVPELTWTKLTVSKSSLASKLLNGERVKLNNAVYVPLSGLSPRRRVILDGICAYFKLQNAPAHCRVERSPYLTGVDILIFRDVQPHQRGSLHQRVKRFLLRPLDPKDKRIATALRQAILTNERSINAPSSAVKWMQQRLWEPGRGWLAKSLWNGLFPEESAVLELSAALKSLGEETL